MCIPHIQEKKYVFPIRDKYEKYRLATFVFLKIHLLCYKIGYFKIYFRCINSRPPEIRADFRGKLLMAEAVVGHENSSRNGQIQSSSGTRMQAAMVCSAKMAITNSAKSQCRDNSEKLKG